MRALWSRFRDERGQSLVEVMIAVVLFGVVVVAVDSSITVIQERHVQVTNQIEALDNLQVAQEAITTDLRAASTWTTPALPTSAPSQAITASWSGSGGCGLVFTATLKSNTATIDICLNTTTHVLTVTCSGASACPGGSSATVTQAQVSNIDSSSSFTFTTKEVSTTENSVTTNSFFFTDVASTLILDSPRVGAPRVSQTIFTSPTVEIYNAEYACQQALEGTQATGSC
jgi:type II secretory pathway component PulJ